jgi:thiamine transport system permease protein
MHTPLPKPATPTTARKFGSAGEDAGTYAGTSARVGAGLVTRTGSLLTPLALAAVPLGFLLLVLVAPVLRLGLEAAAQSALPWAQMLGSAYVQKVLLWSVLQAGISCAVVAVLALPIAWALARLQFVGRGAVLRLLMLPFVVPTLVAAMGVLALAGPQGLGQRWFGVDAQDTPYLLLYGNVFFNLPLAVRAGVDGLQRISAAQLAAAQSLGAPPWRVFWRVEWPQLQPWLASSLCLVFLYCFSSFGLALVLGGQRFATLEVEIYTLVAHELQLQQASVLALLSFCLSASLAWAYTRREQRLAAPLRADALPPRAPRSSGERLVLAVALGLLFVCCAAPLLALAWRVLLSGTQAWAMLLDPDVLQAARNTLVFSALALLVASVLGLLHALAARQSLLLRTAVFLPLVASPVTVAFGLLLLYPKLSSSLVVLVAAYALLAYPFVAKAVGAALDAMPAHLSQAARSLGATPWRVFWRVTLPFMAPSLRRGMAFAAATCLGEFAVSLFLSRPEWATLTTLIYQRLSRPGRANVDEALVLASVLMLLAWLCFKLIDTPGKRMANHA